jgi:SPP1 gp7 family putative phage head morphogenesis protein
VGNGFGLPTELHPIPAGRVVPVVRANRVAAYSVTDGDGEITSMPPEVIVRFYFPDPESPFESEGYLGPNAIATDALKFQKQHIRSLYRDNAIPPAILQGETDASAPSSDARERFNAEWIAQYHRRMGTDRGVPGWIPPGWKIIFAAMQSGAEITPLLDFFTREQLMNFGVPRSVLGEVVSGDRSSAETNQFVFDLHTVSPIARLIENALTLQLAREFGDDIIVEFEEFVSRDKDFMLKKQAQDLALKVRSINQVREDEELDPVPWGELPVGTLADEPYTGEERDDLFGLGDEPDAFGDPEPEPPEEDEEVEEPEVEEESERQRDAGTYTRAKGKLYERIFGRVMHQRLKKIIRRQEKVTLARFKGVTIPRQRILIDDFFNTDEWRQLFDELIMPVERSIFARAGQETMAAVGQGDKPFIFSTAVTSIIEEQGSLLATRTGETTKGRLERALMQGVEAGESIDQISKRLEKVFEGRRKNMRTVARTEVGRAFQGGQLEGARSSGVVEYKRWITSQDAAVRDSHAAMEGITIPLDNDFDVLGETADGPFDIRLSAGNLINCRCDLTFPRDVKQQGE